MKTLAPLLALMLGLLVPASAFGQDPGEDVSDEVKQLIQSAQTKARAQNVQGALDDLVRALELNPKLRRIWISCGRFRSILEDHEGAVKDFSQAIELNDSDPGGYVLRAGARQRLKDHDGAITDFTSAIGVSNGAHRLLRMRGLVQQAKKDYDAAEKDFTASIEKNEGYWPALLSRAGLRELTGDLVGAEKDYSSVCSLNAEFAPAYISRAEVKAALGKFKASLEDYENALFLVQGKNKASVLASRARVRFVSGDKDGSKADFKAAIEILPDSQIYFSRGLLRYDMAMYKESLADLRKALQLNLRHEYGRLFICLARMHLGEQEAAQKELAEYLDGRDEKDDWFTKVAGFLAGAISEEAFLEASEDKNPYTTREQSCEAYWYTGAVALIAGDKKKALQNMSLCVAFNVHNFIEFQSSQAVLRREKTPPK